MIHQAVFMILLMCVHVRDEYTGSKFLLALLACRTDYNSKGVTDQSNYAVRDVWAGKGFRHSAHMKCFSVKDTCNFKP